MRSFADRTSPLSCAAALLLCTACSMFTGGGEQELDCNTHSDCPRGFTCEQGRCVEVEPDPGDAAVRDIGRGDAALRDAVMPESGFPDSGLPDTAAPDTAQPDASAPDSARPDTTPSGGCTSDVDGDGFGAGCAAGEDCDEYDPGRAYGLPELCDGIDNDCNGIADDPGVCPCDRVLGPNNDDLRPYLFCDYETHWDEGRRLCQRLGAYRLAVVESDSEASWIASEIAVRTMSSYWLGASDRAEEGVWRWLDGSSAYPEGLWNQGEPNNFGPYGEDCLFSSDNMWMDVVCGMYFPGTICEAYPEDRDPFAYCVDGDGDRRGVGCPLGPDCDDGDATRFALQLGYPDRDYDGYSTNTPTLVCEGVDTPGYLRAAPSAKSDCDDASATVTTGCSCARRERHGKDWLFCTDARGFAAAEILCGTLYDGWLAITSDMDDNAWAAREGHGFLPDANWWIGLREVAGTWSWVDGSLLTESAFKWTDPNYGANACAHLYRDPGGWADYACTQAFPYICEGP